MLGEPGRFPVVYLKLVSSQRAARFGEQLMLRAEGTDAASMDRGKLISVEREKDGSWEFIGTLIGSSHRDGRSRWIAASSPGAFAVSMEAYRGDSPLYVDVPPLPPGDYRFRLDLMRTGDESIRDRTATLYAPFRVFT
jgi:hypothetical protein